MNLSAKSLGDPQFPEWVEQRLAASAIDASCLIFEITETAAIAKMDEAKNFVTRLTHLGCRFALDDFGAGFGSFHYVKYLPVDFVKIDGDFVRNVTESSTDQSVVKAIVQLARGLGKKTIAEFVGDDPRSSCCVIRRGLRAGLSRGRAPAGPRRALAGPRFRPASVPACREHSDSRTRAVRDAPDCARRAALGRVLSRRGRPVRWRSTCRSATRRSSGSASAGVRCSGCGGSAPRSTP